MLRSRRLQIAAFLIFEAHMPMWQWPFCQLRRQDRPEDFAQKDFQLDYYRMTIHLSAFEEGKEPCFIASAAESDRLSVQLFSSRI